MSSIVPPYLHSRSRPSSTINENVTRPPGTTLFVLGVVRQASYGGVDESTKGIDDAFFWAKFVVCGL